MGFNAYVLLILKTLRGLSIPEPHNSRGVGYLGSGRIFDIHRSAQSLGWFRMVACLKNNDGNHACSH